jgi:hypothetical protein
MRHQTLEGRTKEARWPQEERAGAQAAAGPESHSHFGDSKGP